MSAKLAVVDDDLIQVKTLAQIMTKYDYEIVGAFYNAEELLEALPELEENNLLPDIIIIDVYLPGKFNGIELAQQIMPKYDSAVVFITADSDIANLTLDKQTLPYAFHLKPINYEQLHLTIITALNLREHILSLKQELQSRMVQHAQLASLGLLSAGIAHEINNPSMFISANNQTLKQFWPYLETLLGSCNESMDDYNRYKFILSKMPQMLKGIDEGVERISAIVNTLKGYAHREQKKSHKPIDINEAITVSCNLSYNTLKHNVNVEVQLDRTIPKVSGNFQEITQVLVNILLNGYDAIKHLDNAKILIATSLTSTSMVEIRVENNGPPIDLDNLERIWEPFFTTKPIGVGTGLGLSISKQLIEQHRGTMKADNLGSEEGVVFSIQLPPLVKRGEDDNRE